MIDYDELDGIVGCYCTLVYPYRGHSEGTVIADAEFKYMQQKY